MITIAPVSDLRDYDKLLDRVSAGSPVYLTQNGRDMYCIRDMEDESRFQESEAMIKLLCELNAGITSAENTGWISEEDFRSRIRSRRVNTNEL